jgi:3-oxosteroid 1-dehydrogenase
MDREHVIVVGAGISGLGVALRGGSATVYEAADLVGGAAAYSGGRVRVGANHVAEREGIDDDLEEDAIEIKLDRPVTELITEDGGRRRPHP